MTPALDIGKACMGKAEAIVAVATIRRLARPRLPKLLAFLHLAILDPASGVYLWRRGSAEPGLDLIGGYGTLLLGHSHPELSRAAVAHLNGGSARGPQEP